MFHVYFRRVCILLHFDEMFYINLSLPGLKTAAYLLIFFSQWSAHVRKWSVKIPCCDCVAAVPLFRSVNNCCMYFGVPILYAYLLITCFLGDLSHLSLCKVYHCPLLTFLTWSLFYQIWLWLHPFCFGIHLIGELSFISSLEVFVFRVEISLLEAAYSWVLFSNPSSHCVFWLVNSIHLNVGWLLTNEISVLPF